MNKIKKRSGIVFHAGWIFLIAALTAFLTVTIPCFSTNAYASATENVTEQKDKKQEQNNDGAGVNISVNSEGGQISGNLKMMLVLTVLALAPSILIMLTSFTRIIIVLHFLRTALGIQSAPPNQVLVGLALFLTIFIMNPVFAQINEDAIKPYDAGEITMEQAMDRGTAPLKEFMCKQVKRKDLNNFCEIAEKEYEVDEETGEIIVSSIPLQVLIPSFIISELRAAFILGFVIYIPFIVIDMVVASVLMSMGMMMLPPTTISMPFKILLFILADGWNLVIVNLVKTFY